MRSKITKLLRHYLRPRQVYSDTHEEAKRNISRSDTARAAYYRSIFGRECCDKRNDDLMVDSSIGVKKTAEVLCRYIYIQEAKIIMTEEFPSKNNRMTIYLTCSHQYSHTSQANKRSPSYASDDVRINTNH